MALTKEKKQEVMGKFQVGTSDTGSTPVQIALLTERINILTDHFKANPKDHGSRRGLLQLVGQRRRLLNYLKKNSLDKYQELIGRLNLRK